MWSVCYNRNQCLHNKQGKSDIAVLEWITHSMHSHSKKQTLDSTSRVHCPSTTSYEKWQPPPQGHFTMNIDATLDHQCNVMGVGATIRNFIGQSMVALSKNVLVQFSPKEMEAKALVVGLSLAIDVGLPLNSIQTDALLVA